jgi:FtsP/CotA-like multicopper oxidase with cupredoxin domain
VIGRRRFLQLSGLGLSVGALGLAGCAATSSGTEPAPDFIGPFDPEVRAAEEARRWSGRTTAVTLTAGLATVDLGGRVVESWALGDTLVGQPIYASPGDRVDATLRNQLAEDTTMHWHGVRIRNDMDGAAPVTQKAVAPGESFDYSFIVPDYGTHWYHSHSGLQGDRGLFGALIVEDPDDATGADADALVILDDWVDGLGTAPETVLAALNPALTGGHMGGGGGPVGYHPDAIAYAEEITTQPHAQSEPLRGMTQHIAYPMHLVNGRPGNDPEPILAKPGQRLRLRIINAAAETPYRFAVAGHELTIIAADGFDVEPKTADAIIIGMAQRYDVLITVKSGQWPVIAQVEGRAAAAAAILRTTDVQPTAEALPSSIPELSGRLVMESELIPAEHARLAPRDPDRDYRIDLIQAGDRYVWGMAGPDAGNLYMKPGERVRITMNNTSPMWHPMHTHGHTFAVPQYGGLRRDTVNVLPGEELAIEFDADNPGEWMFHCHNLYHFDAGMTANLRYVR